jgi:hypothetical protein
MLFFSNVMLVSDPNVHGNFDAVVDGHATMFRSWIYRATFVSIEPEDGTTLGWHDMYPSPRKKCGATRQRLHQVSQDG